MNAAAAPQLLDALAYALAFEPTAEAAGNLTVGRGKLGDVPVRVGIIENKIASGSLGSLECQRLAALFAVAVRERSPLVIHLDSAGARVSEGLKALGAFRALYRAGLEAALGGVRIAVTLGRNCFGGSSMLAHLAARRLLQESTQLAMSGPSVIATANGVDAMDEMFRAMAQAAMSATARATTSPANRVWKPGDDVAAWLGEALVPVPDPAGALRVRHEELGRRLPKSPGPRPMEALRRRDLEKIYVQGYETRESDGFLQGQGTRDGEREEIVGIVGKSPLDAARAWRFSEAVWKMSGAAPERLEVMLDCASHAPRLEDERIVLTEFIVDMGFALAALGARGTRVGLTVLGKAGGGVYVALAAPARRVASVYGAADIQVLPGAAVAAILGESRDESATFKDYSAAGVADEELKLGIIPGEDMSENLYELFESRFPRDASQPLLLFDARAPLTYGQAQEGIARLAAYLVSLGLAPGERIAVQVEKSPEALLLYLACLRAGLVYLPLNSAYQEAEIAYFLGDSEPAAIVAQPASLAWMRPLAQRKGVRHVLSLDEHGGGTLMEGARTAPASFATVPRNGDELAAILYTSGTTGRSKGAMISHRNLAANATVLHRAWGFGPRDVLIHMLPLFHVHGLFVASHCVLMNGTAMRFHAKFDARRALAQMPQSTVFMGVPTLYTRLLAEPGLDREACRDMRLFVSGSAPLLAETHVQFEKRTGHRILERYGMTETGMLTTNPLEGERRAGSVGTALPGTDVRVVDDGDGPVAPGTIGHVQVRGANVFAGYWRMPERNRDEFTPDGFFRTGDMGSLSKDGYLTIAGRSKDLIISGGYNVYPKEIELAIDEMPGVAESAVVGVPHADFGEAVTAVVVPSHDVKAPTEAEVIASLRTLLANFKVPKRVYFVEELPRNAMGKVQKNLLRDRFKE